jgi:hypothetical protein
VLINQNPNISYDAGTGAFTISATGNYYISWWIAIDGAGASPTAAFAIEIDGGGGILGATPAVTSQLVGSALVTVAAVPATITLVNVTGQPVFLANTLVQADIVIMEVA